MSDSQRPRGNSAKPSPPLSVAAARRSIVRHVVRGAVDAYNEALRAKAEAEAGFYAEDQKLDPMFDVVCHRVEDARLTLLRAILSISDRGDARGSHRAEMRLGSPCGVALDGRLYLVVPDPERSDGMEPGAAARDEHGPPVMMLSVVDRAAVDDMDDVTIHDLEEAAPPVQVQAPPSDEAEEDDDEPDDSMEVIDTRPGSARRSAAQRDLAAWEASQRPPGPDGPRLAPKGPHHDRPLPLLRATHTIVAPWDPWPLTLELIVLVETVGDDDRTAGPADVEELSQGGWSNHSVGPLNVFTRLIC